MSTHSHDLQIPRVPLLGGMALVLVTVLAVATVRFSGIDISTESHSPVVAQRALHFIDLPDGGIDVREDRAGGQALLQRVPASEHGFLRGTVRALARERRLAGVGPEQAFLLQAHADGRLTLQDPSTGRRVDLESFGPSNSDVFARLLAGQALPKSPMAR